VAAFAVAVAVIAALAPPAAIRLAPDRSPGRRTVAGAFHVHSNRSDGSGSVDDIAAAARRAGLGFVVLTDHGDGTRLPDPPAYRDGVLTIDGVEISTSGGHYAVIGMRPAPEAIWGDARSVVDKVTALEGFGFAAHGDSPRDELRWTAWDVPIRGVEWINLDSEWRRASVSQLVRAFTAYWFRPPEAVGSLAGAAALLHRIDDLASSRHVTIIGTTDTHGLFLPSYEACFRTLSTNVELESPATGDAAIDAAAIVAALAAGRHYTAIDAYATPASFEFTADAGSGESTPARQGERLAGGSRIVLSSRVAGPPGAELRLLRNGKVVRESRSQTMIYQTDGGAGAYRVEVWLPGRPIPWIVSNPIWIGATLT
jgi:hypothetical protein